MKPQVVINRLGQLRASEKEKREHTIALGLHLDIRLVTLVAVLWIVTFWGFYIGWEETFIWAIISTGSGILLLLSILYYFGFIKQLAPALLLIILALLLQISLMQTKGTFESTRTITQLSGEQVIVTGEVTRSKKISADRFLVEIQSSTISLSQTNHSVNRKITAFTHESPPRGVTIEFLGELEKDGAGILLKNTFIRSQNQQISSPIQIFKDRLGNDLSQKIGNNSASLILGLGYGDDSLLSEEARDHFRISGLTHLTAVSGSNISLIFVVVYRCGQYFRLPRNFLILGGFLATFIYALFVGWEGSVVRSWSMGCLGALGLILGHGKQMIALLSSCLVLLLFYKPELSYNLGFVLSSIATFGLVVFAPALSRILSLLIPVAVAEALSIPLAASLWCSPVIVLVQNKLGTYTVFANLLAAPLVPALTVLGLIIALLYSLGIFIDPLVLLAGWFAHCLLLVAKLCAIAPGAVIVFENPHDGTLLMLLCALLLSTTVLITDYILFGKSKRAAFERRQRV